ncbi:copper resistance protein NlpE [Flavobacterium pectinovorum]|uniref:Copper resistance protein NlpE n=1 Tax=Flavobacterium pectinovorum TaxID=29533 RepID=A0A502EXR8_9FLAO|nr:copper resistance protein NlpE [Flavobacterium pectinovorum]TPG40941.1 copper resistance protein NlpE [Flavobacterium pectinovorum]
MKKLVLILAISSLIISCNSKKKENLTNTSIDSTAAIIDDTRSLVSESESLGEAKTYEGVLPCADCSGIKTVLKIYAGDGTMETHKFDLSSVYQGKGDGKEFTQKGNYNTERGLEDDPNGTIYVLNYDKPEGEQIFYGYSAKSPDKLFLLDHDRKIIKTKQVYALTLQLDN